MREIFSELGPLPRHINSPAYDYSIEFLAKKYGLQIYTYDSSMNHNGWVIPPKYSVKSAWIKFNGAIIYDGTRHPLSVISYSASFSGRVSKKELIQHCFCDDRNENWIPYHFRQSYRPWARDWGFCLPKKLLTSLLDGDYEVCIDIEEGKEELKVGRGFIKGQSPLNIALCAHLDHPGLVNDDLSGVVVILEVLERLKKSTLNYGLEVFIVPEIIGPQYFLNNNAAPFEGLFVESVGQKGVFHLQSSLQGESIMDSVASRCVVDEYLGEVVPFRTIYGNDEINFETFGCPMPSLTRGKFQGYHSSEDNAAHISIEKVSEAIDLVEKIVLKYQTECIVERQFSGLCSLANPCYDLYIDPGQLAFGIKGENMGLRKIMDVMSTLGKFTPLKRILDVSEELDSAVATDYLKRWEKAGLIKLHGVL